MGGFLKGRKLTILVGFAGLGAGLYFIGDHFQNTQSTVDHSYDNIKLETIQAVLRDQLKDPYPSTELFLMSNEQTVPVSLQYTLDESLQNYVTKIAETVRPDYAAFVAIEPESGKILSLVSRSRNPHDYGNLALRAVFPAASIFKMVTAAAGLDREKFSPDTVVPFNGGSHTLYRGNVNKTRYDRWTRYMTVKEAFAKSINTVFGKIGIFQVGPWDLLNYAERFQFNKSPNLQVPAEFGKVKINAEDKWTIAEVASGYTDDATMSPLQGAMMAASVINEGIMQTPYMIEKVTDKNGTILYEAQSQELSKTMNPQTTIEMRKVMRETIVRGTSAKAFRSLMRLKRFDKVEIGGKTGSLTGSDPKGKCDWFVGYAKWKTKKIAIAALTVNEDKWRIKSSHWAAAAIHHYYKNQMEKEINPASR